ncbi:MAG: tetratricopeptide repeat protein [Planctomycetota bacterium]
MSPTATGNQGWIEGVVSTLTQSVKGELNAAEVLREQVRRAGEEIDESSAVELATAVLAELDPESEEPQQLEALVIACLAHPAALEKHRSVLAGHGRRLSHILEHGGHADRARAVLEQLAARLPGENGIDHDLAALMRRSGSSEALIERYLRRAEDAVRLGKPMDAVGLLQEVVLLDRNRRDVARMIRDLRYQEKERHEKNRRRIKLAAGSLVLAVLLGAIAIREFDVRAQYASLPSANEGNLNSMKSRLTAIEDLIETNYAWIGMPAALSERSRLRTEVSVLESQFAQKKREEELEKKHRAEMAEDMRTRGLQYAQQGKFDLALADFRRALELAAESWEHRARVRADVEAIEAWKKGGK